MIVAAYKSGNALWATVMPVSSMMRFDRFPGQQQSAKKPTNKKAVFAAVLLSAESALEAAELQDVRARA